MKFRHIVPKYRIPSFYNSKFDKFPDVSPKAYSITEQEESKDCTSMRLIKLISWNLNMETHSVYASDEWITHNNKWDYVYAECTKQDADIIAFQELPEKYDKNSEAAHPLIQKYIATNNWHITESNASHCGHSIILIRKRLESVFEIAFDKEIDPNKQFPAILLTQNNEAKLLLFCVHLSPFKGNASKRRKQIDRLFDLSLSKNMSENVVICGDTNMDYFEEVNVMNAYNGQLTCNWGLIPDEFKKDCMFTWYMNYFEIGAKERSRFDKVFFGKMIKCAKVKVFDECVSDNPLHFLSDHRGLCVTLQIY